MAKAKERKKKHWIKIVAPSEFGNKIIGETICSEAKNIIGRTLKVNVFSVTGDFKKQNTHLAFVVKDVTDGKASTELYRYYVSLSHLKRMVRKAKNKIDDSFVVDTKDNIKIKIKPVMLTKQKTSRSVLTALRKKAREIISNYSKVNSFSNFVREVISNKVQIITKKELKSVYPLSLYEIKSIEKIK